MSKFYEGLPTMTSEDGLERLHASFSPNNGIRVSIQNDDLDGLAGFDFDENQAEQLGQALVRWAQRRRAEWELIRCGYTVREP